MRKTIITTSILGFILIIISTFLQTVTISRIDENINNYSSSVDSCRRIQSSGTSFHIDYKITEVEKRIAMFERDVFLIFQLKEHIEPLEEEIYEDYLFLIRMWSGLFTYVSLSNPNVASNVSKAKAIIDSNNDYLIKQKELSKLLNHIKEVEAPTNIEKVNKTLKDKKELKEQYVKKKRKTNSWFLIVQISGLIIMSISGILEKFFVKKLI